MDDGTPYRSGFILHTESFCMQEVQLLLDVFKNKFQLNCYIHTRKDRVNIPYLLYIRADSWDKFKSLIEPYCNTLFQL